jgi:catechol 2,3-dioxygenase-like lactoylglutathione lyase family enzyme
MISRIAYVSIGVTCMATALELWVEQLGLQVIARRDGPDPQLGQLWELPTDQIVCQVLLSTPGAVSGRIHLVQFREPAEPVRKGAVPTDLGAKNIDVNCTDMPMLIERLREAGYSFRSAMAEYEIDGIKAREVQMPIHDDINLVLIEVLSKGFEVGYSAKGYAALTSFVVIVPDVAREVDFYKQLFAMTDILSHKLSGPAIEMAAGLPPGTVLDLHLLGEPDNLFGRMELIEYVGVKGANCFERAVVPATGILSCGFMVESLDDFISDAVKLNVTINRKNKKKLLFGSGEVAALVSPAGLKIWLHQIPFE